MDWGWDSVPPGPTPPRAPAPGPYQTPRSLSIANRTCLYISINDLSFTSHDIGQSLPSKTGSVQDAKNSKILYDSAPAKSIDPSLYVFKNMRGQRLRIQFLRM